MTDTYITVSGLRLYCHHGVGEQERRVGNWFTFDITLHYDASAAMATDDVARALSYADVIALVRREAAVPSRLLEHLAGRILRAVVAEWPAITAGSITVAKPHPPVGQPVAASFTVAW